MTSNKICRLKTKVLKAEYALHEAIREAFPIGSMVTCHKGRGCVTVEVIGHSGSEVRVQNQMSGKVYSVSYFYLHACHACKTDRCYKQAQKGRKA